MLFRESCFLYDSNIYDFESKSTVKAIDCFSGEPFSAGAEDIMIFCNELISISGMFAFFHLYYDF